MRAEPVAKTVAVVGGGLAGIAASVALAQAGFQVELIEANQRLGGRVGSFTDPTTDEAFDYCQHVGMACCTNLLHLIDTLGQQDQWYRETTLHFYASNGKHLPLTASPLPAPLHLSGLLRHWPGLSVWERVRIASALLKLIRVRDNDPSLNGFALPWLERTQSASVIERFWNTILVSALGESIDRVALRPARKVLLDGFARNRNAYHVLVPKRPLSELFDQRVQTWFAGLSNVRARLSTKVECVTLSTDENQRPSICIGDGSQATYDAVIVAVPWHRVTSLLQVDIDNDPKSLETAPITGIHTWWNRPWMNTPHAILVDRLCQWIFAKQPNAEDASLRKDNDLENTSTYYQIVISSSRNFNLKKAAEVEAALKQDLVGIFPELQTAKLQSCKVVTDPRSVFSVTPESERYRWQCDRFARQHVWVAGDWTSTGWPATMEGAIRSGYSAASGVAARFGIELQLPVQELQPGKLVQWIGSLLRSEKPST